MKIKTKETTHKLTVTDDELAAITFALGEVRFEDWQENGFVIADVLDLYDDAAGYAEELGLA